MTTEPDGAPVTPERAAEQAAIKAAVARRIGPELATAHLVRLVALPFEVLLPLLRLAWGRTGVALAPDLVTQLNTLVAVGVVHVRRGRARSPAEPWVAVGAGVWCALSPLFAVRSERLVVLRGRSPLWGWVMGGVLSLPQGIASVTAMLTVMRSARAEHRRSLAD